MGLKILTGRDGRGWRDTWYGRISVRGRLSTVNLGVPIAGTIPTDAEGNVRLSGRGDEAFEKSRKAAEAVFRKLKAEAQKDPAELQRKAFMMRTGVDLEGLPLSKLYENWTLVSRAKTPSSGWCSMVKGWFEHFTAFAQAEARKHRKRCETANDVTPEIVKLWFDSVRSEYSWESTLKMKHLLSGTFQRLQAAGLVNTNPFADMQLRGGCTGKGAKVPRKALTAAETERLFACARNTDLYGLAVCAASTGMRIGDVCRLKWSDIDMKAGLIDCVTAKTGARVTIPIFGRLMEVLKSQSAVFADGKTPSAFVFPEWAEAYDHTNEKGHFTTRNKIVQAVKPLIARAVFGDRGQDPVDADEAGETIRPIEDALADGRFFEAKRNRLLSVYRLFKAGERPIDIAAALGVARSQVSTDLREIEKLTGERLRPHATAVKNRRQRLALIEKTRVRRGIGKRSASVYGWHCLRHSFVVLALNAGVPVESVRRIVGHGDAKTTLDNYFNPERKHAAENLRQKLRGSVLDGRSAPCEKISDGTLTGGELAPVKNRAVRSLALARAVLDAEQTATVNAVLEAAGVDDGNDSARAVALIAATVDDQTRQRISAVIRAAGA